MPSHVLTFFSLSLDTRSREYLSDTAKWGRFLAITGMVFTAIIVLLATLGITGLSRSNIDLETGRTGSILAAERIGLTIGYALISAVFFFPMLYLLRFSNRLRAALAAEDQDGLSIAFLNLKRCFRFVGILTIIMLIIYALSILFIVTRLSTL
jgi:hypothetical protein